MAKPTISSKELNEKMESVDANIKSINNEIEGIKSDLVKKMLVLRNEDQYRARLAADISSYLEGGHYNPREGSDKIVFGQQKGLHGDFEVYGNTIHPKFLRVPRNIFNITTSSGILFRNNALAYVNDERDLEATFALMADGTKGKDVYFQEYDSKEIVFRVDIDRSSLLGDTHFNIIDILPYLDGSFNIKKLKVWEITNPSQPSLEIDNIEKVGKSRIVLDKKYEMSSVEFTIELTFKNGAGKYPFGLHSLQFLNADFKGDSYVIMEVSKTDYIEYVGKDLLMRTYKGGEMTTINDESIDVYVEYQDGVLSGQVEISTDDVIYPIARNARTLYLHMPLKKALQTLTILQVSTR